MIGNQQQQARTSCCCCPLQRCTRMLMSGRRLTCRVVHGEEVRVRDAQGLRHAGGDEVLADHDALVGIDVAVAAAQRRGLRQPCAPVIHADSAVWKEAGVSPRPLDAPMR